MKILNVEQGSREWLHARLGIPTGSCADSLITPKTRKPSAQSVGYRNRLVAEWLLGYPLEDGSSGWMDRGIELEDEARTYYEFDRDVEVERIGFVTTDDGQFGGSPDGLIGLDGGLEIKVPAAHTHVGYLLHPASLVEKYLGQVQSYMSITGRQWWDVFSYCPGLPEVVERVPRDEAYIAALDAALVPFLEDLNAAKDKLRAHKHTSILEAVA